MHRRFVHLVLVAAGLVFAAGCQSPAHTDYAAFVKEPRPTVVGQDYRVGVPDELMVTIMSDRGVEEVKQTLGPDGRLRLKGFGQVQAAGLTCAQITEQLNAIAQTTEGITSLAVRVNTFASQKVFVFGQVESTGAQAYHGRNSVLEVVAAAKLNVRADVHRVEVLRPSPDGAFRRKMTVDLDAMIRAGDTTLDVVLAEGDVVYVPATPLGSVGLALERVFGSTAKASAIPAPEPREIALVPSDEVPTPDPQPASVEHIHTTDARTLAALDELRAALTELSAQVEAQRESQAAWLAELEHARQQDHEQVIFESRDLSVGFAAQGTSTIDPSEWTTADVQRGGAGEDAAHEGVRFWGP